MIDENEGNFFKGLLFGTPLSIPVMDFFLGMGKIDH